MPPALIELVGWCSILLGFASGAVLGLEFHRPDFLGGYDALPRRLIRLGHIALLALGILNVLFAQSIPRLRLAPHELAIAQWAMIVGNISMPLCCALAAWRITLRRLFVIPVAALIAGVYSICAGLFRAV